MPDPALSGSEQIDDNARGINERSLEQRAVPEPSIPATKTSMTTDAPPLEKRPRKRPKYPLLIKDIDVFRLAGSEVDPDQEVAAASRIWSQCGIEFRIVSRRFYDESQTRRLLSATPEDSQKPVRELRVVVNPVQQTPSMRNLRQEWSNNNRGAYGAFFAPNVFLTTSGAPSASDPDFDIVYIGERQYWTGWELAHELGHRLIGPQLTHGDLRSPLMKPRNPGDEIVELECRAARGDSKALYEIIRRSQ